MRILCCVNRDLPSAVALNLLLPALAGHEVRVGLSERVGRSVPTDEPAGRRTLRLAEQTVPNEVVFPLVERAALPDDGRRQLTFGEWERARGVIVAPLPDPNAPEGLAAVRTFAPDLIVTIRYGAILRPPVIAVPRLGVLNLHSGLLPAYRGVLATFRALLAGDDAIGCTLHYIVDAGIDTGDVVDRARIPVHGDWSLLRHVLALYPAGVPLLARAVERLAAGAALPREAQVAGAGAYFTYPTAAEWEAFARSGREVATVEDLHGALEPFGATAARGGYGVADQPSHAPGHRSSQASA